MTDTRVVAEFARDTGLEYEEALVVLTGAAVHIDDYEGSDDE